MDLITQARKQKGEMLMKQVKEMLDKEGYVLDAVIMQNYKSIFAEAVIRPKNEQEIKPITP